MVYIENLGQSIRAQATPLHTIPATWDAAWNDLAAHASDPNPFYEPWFLRPSIIHLAPEADGRLITVWAGPKLIGLMPLTIAGKYGRMPIRHLENWAHYHCFYAAPLVRKGFERTFWDETLALLDRTKQTPGFLHLVGIDPQSAITVALKASRRTDTVHRSERAMLASNLNSQLYYETHVRKKKRKEIARLRARLDELGPVAFERLAKSAQPHAWIAEFLSLEASGWKGREGSALRADPQTASFFRDTLLAARNAGKLDFSRLTLDGKPIAMLVNFLTGRSGFSFKIAFDENYARFSPGVLIQIENLDLLDRPDIDWMDSCASEDHPMINSLWAQRRAIVRVTVPLAGPARSMMFRGARALEKASATLRAMR